MIPKIIHYCWFGKRDLPKSAIKCMESWSRFLPGCEIKRWDESNYDFRKRNYTLEAYEMGKYAFVSDVARLDVVYNEGGIYLDTDVELIKDITPLLHYSAYMGFQGKSRDGKCYVNTGIGFGSEAGNPIIKEMIEDYDKVNFIKRDGSLDMLSCPVRNSKVLEKHGLIYNGLKQQLEGIVIMEPSVLCPMDEITGRLVINESKTLSIHYFDATWLSKKKRVKRCIRRLIGPDLLRFY
ncbi:glycosyltransferase [[Clostridium] symbiosum]|uniref:glycosyltransferase family 32 protein n=1 Tax=Clostridium symbiosum TaxID=1512 RepID=UPI001D08D347|nr:glycosyltransferase [[Clostridium] symbiosum]MCB6607716.1 glycosyl transferase [[Clostridium] symbiosum]MCB6932577.1 glycosyl transferase [[Clostridium] symbiosum]